MITTHESQSIVPPNQTTRAIQGIKYRWLNKPHDQRIIVERALAHNLPIPIAHVLHTRGYTDEHAIRTFLFSSYEKDVPHASLMKGMNAAVERLERAVDNHEKILIFGDYDVDGVTSSSLALSALLPLGANINFFLPNRERDGYGLSVKGVQRAAENGYKLIITVDNGIAAHAAAQRAQELGIDLIITDHHRPHADVPPALAVVDPHQHDCAYPFKYLAGVGVTFKLMCLLYERKGIEALPEKAYELLMLGTVADVVPLLGENRFWVRHGLSKVRGFKSNALRVLAANNNLSKEIWNSLDIGFMIAPQINALGRLADAREAVKFMISSDFSEVERIGAILKSMNDERKKVEASIYQQMDDMIGKLDIAKEYVIIGANDQWPAGVIGLVAGKLMHNYGKPTIMFHLDDQGFAKGSCRSLPEFDIFHALSECSDLITQFGGHACAAGLKLPAKNVPILKERLTDLIAKKLSLDDLHPRLTIDAPLTFPEINGQLVDGLEQLEPFGNSNPQPIFAINDVTLVKPPQIMKERHLKCLAFSQGVLKQIVFFNRPDLIGVFEQLRDKPFHVAGHVTTNHWNGKTSIELQGLDIALTD